jgi:hypothetical protein
MYLEMDFPLAENKIV